MPESAPGTGRECRGRSGPWADRHGVKETDGERRAALLEEVGDGGQVIVTSVEAGPFPPDLIARAMVWTVNDGRIEPCG